MYKISIIVPVFQVENFIQECLESLVNQTLDSIEIVCVNDGSYDNSLKIIEEYKRRFKFIRLINQENQGLSGARNTGLKHISGEYLLFVDGDDFLEPNVLASIYEIASDNNLDILDFYINSVEDNIKRIWKNQYLKIDTPITGEIYFNKYIKQFRNQPPVSAWSHLYRTEFIKQNHLEFIRDRYYEDIPFTAEAYLVANRVYFTDIQVYNYRHNESSITKGTFKPKHLLDNIYISMIINKISLKYNVKIPMDNFFNALIKQMIMFAKSGRFNEIMDLLNPNVFKRINYSLYSSRSSLLYSLLKINLFFCLFLFGLQTINRKNFK